MPNSDYEWRSERCHNPNKSWITRNGEKISALMSTTSARKLVEDHNKTVKYLCGWITELEKTGTVK